MNESVERGSVQRFQRWARRVLSGVLLLSLALGFVGYLQYFNLRWPLYWVDGVNLFYLDLQLFGFEFTSRPDTPVPWLLQIARVIAPITTFFAVVAAASMVFREQVGWFLARTLRLNYAIVIGSSEAARAIAQAKRETTTVHEIDEGDIASLRRAGIRRARTVYACADDREDAAANVAIALAAVECKSRARLRINAQVTDPEFALGLKARRLMAEDGKGKVVEFFSIDEMAAQQFVIEDKIDPAAPGEILIAGAGVFGRSTLVAFAKAWRAMEKPKESLSVILVDPEATRIAAQLAARWPVVSEYCRIIPDERALTDVLHAAGFAAPYRSFICYEDEHHALSTALAAVPLWHGGPGSLVVRISRLRLLRTANQLKDTLLDSLGDRLRFAVVPRLAGALVAQDPDPVAELARAIHEDYVEREGKENPEAKMGEGALVPWKDLARDFKYANYGQADGVSNLLRLIGATIAPRSAMAEKFTIAPDEVKRLAPTEHERWMAERIQHGWTYGKTRDNARKKHPALKPWDMLGDQDKRRDYDAIERLETIVDRILGDMGFQIVRLRG